jgi:hypothetical protein
VELLKTKVMAKFARQERITDASLREAIERAERGLVDADLGGGLIKQRVARRGQGRSGGYRVFIAYRNRTRAVALYGFPKNDRENLDDHELQQLRLIGLNWLNAQQTVIARALRDGTLQEISFEPESA